MMTFFMSLFLILDKIFFTKDYVLKLLGHKLMYVLLKSCLAFLCLLELLHSTQDLYHT